ncbi:hypothetical protein RRG08_045823 [Elysia crispata]|uniref:Glycosyltransferase family 92 protein n=1 Tax=Elysia crispata TaxID=231223 RepID=A0AAE1D6T3_9GAST|nr:hypothetical protein RRG08_045823 [Elysia crispata]
MLQVVMVTHWVIPISRRDRDRGEGVPEVDGGRSSCCTMSQATADWKPSKGALLTGLGPVLYPEPTTEGPQKFSQIGTLNVWLFSAFYDRDTGGYGGPIVRLFGLAARGFSKKPVLCRFSSPGQGEVTTKGRLLMLPDDHLVKIPPFEVECPLKGGPIPATVSVSIEKEGGATDPIVVEYRARRKRKREFTVCFASFHSKFNFTSQLVQAVELNLLLGAEHFFLYNTSISAATDTVIRHYQALGIFTVVQWPVPDESWYFAQMALINDCIYRNRNQSEYVVFTDTDEFVIPRSHMTWHDMVADLFRDPGLSHVFSHTVNAGVPPANSMLPRRRLLSVNDNGKGLAGQVVPANVAEISGNKEKGKLEVKDLNKLPVQEKASADKQTGKIQQGQQLQQQPQIQAQQQQQQQQQRLSAQQAPQNSHKELMVEQQNQQPQHAQPVGAQKQQSKSQSAEKKLQPAAQQGPGQLPHQQGEVPLAHALPFHQAHNQLPPLAKQGGNKPAQPAQQVQNPPVQPRQQDQNQGPLPAQQDQNKQPAQPILQQGENPPKQPADLQWSNLLEDVSVPKIPVLDDKSEQELKQRRLPVAAFHFRCVFFDNRMMGPWQSMKASRDGWGLTRDEEDFIDRFQIQPLSVFTRTDYSFADKVRTKIIARPEFVHTMGIHFVRKEVRGSRLGWVKPEVGLLHHYRFFDWKHTNNVDYSAFKFKDELIARLKVRFSALRKIFPQK